MDSRVTGMTVVVMGVSGSGKTTAGKMLAKQTGFYFLDADDFHSTANKEKMKKGIPLSDEDRFPWLQTLRDALRERMSHGTPVILSCSALQRKYREVLRKSDPDYKTTNRNRLRFFCLDAPMDLIASRMKKREENLEHFMPAALLDSQFDLLQIDDDEGITRIDATQTPEAITDQILRRLG